MGGGSPRRNKREKGFSCLLCMVELPNGGCSLQVSNSNADEQLTEIGSVLVSVNGKQSVCTVFLDKIILTDILDVQYLYLRRGISLVSCLGRRAFENSARLTRKSIMPWAAETRILFSRIV